MAFSTSPEIVRLSVFIGLLILFAVLEAAFPRRVRVQPRRRRWLTHAGITIIDTVAARLMGPFITLSVAAFAASKGWGLFNITDWPLWLEIIATLIVLDGLIYVQHVIFHHVPLFWRFHKVHHTDRDLDVTSALRFHPLEIIVSLLYKAGIVALLGPSIFAVFLFEIILNGMAMFNHANLRLPAPLDRALRAVFVTPDMHRIHHSVIVSETNSNYGFNLAVWDRVFRTYRSEPKAGQTGITVGLSEYQTDKPSGLLWSLWLPFRR